MVTNKVWFEHSAQSKFLTHNPVHIVVKILGANTPMPVIQCRFHGSTTVIYSVEMPRSAPPFGTPRELPRVVNADPMIVLDTNRYSVPWQLIGQQVQVAHCATPIQIYLGAKLVADHPHCEGRHQRRLNKAHFQTGSTPVNSDPQDASLIRSLDAYVDYVNAQTEGRHER